MGGRGISFQKYVRKKSYVKCIDNRPYLKLPHLPEQQEPLFGLTIGKVYKLISDPIAERHGMLRVIDESFGEAGSEGLPLPGRLL